MLAPELEGAAIVVLAGGAVALWAIPDGRGCPECPHCAAAHDEAERLQRNLRHEVAHKGFSFRPDAPDRFRCESESCPRNARLAWGAAVQAAVEPTHAPHGVAGDRRRRR